MTMVTQRVCPKRHCSLGFLWDGAQETAPGTEERGETVYQQGTVKRWRGICNSRDLKPEHRPTRFRTMAEAEEEAQKVHAARSIDGVPGNYSDMVGEAILAAKRNPGIRAGFAHFPCPRGWANMAGGPA